MGVGALEDGGDPVPRAAARVASAPSGQACTTSWRPGAAARSRADAAVVVREGAVLADEAVGDPDAGHAHRLADRDAVGQRALEAAADDGHVVAVAREAGDLLVGRRSDPGRAEPGREGVQDAGHASPAVTASCARARRRRRRCASTRPSPTTRRAARSAVAARPRTAPAASARGAGAEQGEVDLLPALVAEAALVLRVAVAEVERVDLGVGAEVRDRAQHDGRADPQRADLGVEAGRHPEERAAEDVAELVGDRLAVEAQDPGPGAALLEAQPQERDVLGRAPEAAAQAALVGARGDRLEVGDELAELVRRRKRRRTSRSPSSRSRRRSTLRRLERVRDERACSHAS